MYCQLEMLAYGRDYICTLDFKTHLKLVVFKFLGIRTGRGRRHDPSPSPGSEPRAGLRSPSRRVPRGESGCALAGPAVWNSSCPRASVSPRVTVRLPWPVDQLSQTQVQVAVRRDRDRTRPSARMKLVSMCRGSEAMRAR